MTATPPTAPLTTNRRRARAVAIVALVAIPVLSAAADDDDHHDRRHHQHRAHDHRRRHHDHQHRTHDTTTTADTTTTTADTTTTAADTTTTAAETTTTTPRRRRPRPASPRSSPVPRAPANLRGRRTGDAVALAWNAVPGATTYLVYVASSGAGPFTVAGTRSTPAFTVGNLDVGTRYYFRVFAGNAAGWSPMSATLVVPAVVRPAAPPNLRGRRTGDTVALAWDAVPGAQTYKVYVASSGAGPFTVAGTRSTPAFTVGNLDAGTRYYFRVSAGNAAGWSPTSATLVMGALPPPLPPTSAPAAGRTTSRWRGTPFRERARTSSSWRRRPPARTRS